MDIDVKEQLKMEKDALLQKLQSFSTSREDKEKIMETLSKFEDEKQPEPVVEPVVEDEVKTESPDENTSTFTKFALIIDENTYTKTVPIQDNSASVEILNLNDSLIKTLEKAEQQMKVYEQLNHKLQNDLAQKESVVNSFIQKEKEALKKEFDNKLNNIHNKWCSVFGISNIVEQENVKKMLSTFESKDKLEEISRLLDNKMTQMSDSPQPVTKPSVELETEMVPVFVSKDITRLSEEEKKTYTEKLFERFTQINR